MWVSYPSPGRPVPTRSGLARDRTILGIGLSDTTSGWESGTPSLADLGSAADWAAARLHPSLAQGLVLVSSSILPVSSVALVREVRTVGDIVH